MTLPVSLQTSCCRPESTQNPATSLGWSSPWLGTPWPGAGLLLGEELQPEEEELQPEEQEEELQPEAQEEGGS